MIPTEQLVAALGQLPAQERELLELSMRRRVPDEALATLFDVEEGEVARRRAAAIDRLSRLLDLQRGEDLGNVLKALLEQSTWEQVGAAEAQPPSQPAPPAEEAKAPESAEAERAAAAPVLDLLADRPSSPGPAGPDAVRWPARRVAIGAALTLVAVVGVGALALSSGDSTGNEAATRSQQRVFVPNEANPRRSEPFASGTGARSARNLTAYVRGRPVLYSRPGRGRRRVLASKTQFGTPRVLGVVRRRGDWLAVQAPELRNGEVGWLRARQARLDTSPWSLHMDISRRRLQARRNGQLVRSFTVAVGSPRHPTPRGRFSVTDKLKVTDPESPYGCCVLALTGHQVDLPPDWPGGDRLAVHATRDIGSIGKAVSLGCMRARTSEARWLIDTIPLGSPIFIGS